MGRLLEIKTLKNLFIGGSASDDTLSIGAAFCLAEDLTRKKGKKWTSKNNFPLSNLYLGPEFTIKEEKKH